MRRKSHHQPQTTQAEAEAAAAPAAQPSLRELAARLGVSHSALSAAYRRGDLRQGLELDARRRLIVVDAEAIAAEWRAIHFPRWHEAGRAKTWRDATVPEIRMEDSVLMVGRGDDVIALDPVGLLSDYFDVQAAAALLAYVLLASSGRDTATASRELVERVVEETQDERLAGLVESLLKEAAQRLAPEGPLGADGEERDDEQEGHDARSENSE